MDEAGRWQFIQDLDEELLFGGVIISEWCSYIVRETDVAFVAGAHLATVITAMAGIETYLRSEYVKGRKNTLHDLIARSSLVADLKDQISELRKYRNKWVHVADPWNDQALLDQPKVHEIELENMAMSAVRALRRTIYENQFI